jgi:hypothetical protein
VAVSEAQLETWSAQGGTGQFTDTYQRIRAHLLDAGASPYPVADCEVFLQGSYGNDTNVHGASDVDIVLKYNGAFYYDLSHLPAPAQEAFKVAYPNNAQYGYTQFKAHAEGYITGLYNGVVPGRKALFIPGGNRRRNADVLIAEQFRRYHSFDGNNRTYHDGVALYANGARIENFPKQHSENCTAKHQATNQNFKRMVRVFKNMRNTMIRDGGLAEGVAPSYFLEGMLYNVPNDKFAGTYQNMWIESYNHVVGANRNQLLCANRLHSLVRDGTPTSWPIANFETFTAAARHYWES